jgi:ABC-type phosphate transport system substrate-binding protein
VRVATIFFIATLAALGVSAEAGDVAVIVHRQNPRSAVTAAELAKIFRLDQQHWTGSEKIDLALQESGSAKEQVILERVYRMKDPGELKQFWLAKIFRGDLTAPPRAFASDESVKRFVGASPNAIGYVDEAMLDATVKALRIEGKAPGEPGYLLARR